jgi:hypothetical protein
VGIGNGIRYSDTFSLVKGYKVGIGRRIRYSDPFSLVKG